jgi:hypothetical protein
MLSKTRSTHGEKTKPITGKKANTKNTPATNKPTASGKPIPAETLKKTIAYYYLLSFCPPDKLSEFKRTLAPFREALAKAAGLNMEEYFTLVLPEVCQRIVSFHQVTREPDPKQVESLQKAAQHAHKNSETLITFKKQMAIVAALPGRAKLENRLHRHKGCALCATPCRYGYFTLVSDPSFTQLEKYFAGENLRPKSEQTPLRPVYGFTIDHLARLTDLKQIFCEIDHTSNLAYCLIMLGMAKSRLALPEEQLQIFQSANQMFIQRAVMEPKPKKEQ